MKLHLTSLLLATSCFYTYSTHMPAQRPPSLEYSSHTIDRTTQTLCLLLSGRAHPWTRFSFITDRHNPSIQAELPSGDKITTLESPELPNLIKRPLAILYGKDSTTVTFKIKQ